MRRVSEKYKQSMRAPLRGCSYMRVYLGVFKQDAQNNAQVVLDKNKLSYISDTTEVLGGGESSNNDYASFEHNYTTVAGTMRFACPPELNYKHKKTGVVSRDLLENYPNGFSVKIKSNVPRFNFKGITLDFGENYPIHFKVQAGDDTLEVTDNDKTIYVSEKTFNNVDNGEVTITFLEMKEHKTRARLYNFKYGFGLILDNNIITDSHLVSYISPIQQDLPQIDFKVTIDNKSRYFNVDNPQSAINFLEYGQHLQLSYGYQAEENGEIEWIDKADLVCSGWKSDDNKAILESTDFLRPMTQNYSGGTKVGKQNNCYDLLESILKTAGVKRYYIDKQLKKVYTTNPIPEVPIKQALQLVANMAKAVMVFDYTLGLAFKCNFKPTAEINFENISAISKGQEDSVLENTKKEEYASYSPNYAIVASDGMRFLPRNGKYLGTGFVSQNQSNYNSHVFSSKPSFTVRMDRPYVYQGFYLTFGESLPDKIHVITYKNSQEVEQFDHAIKHKYQYIKHPFLEFEEMTVQFISTKEPQNRVVLHKFKFGDVSDFKYRRNDMLCSPLAIRQDLIKTVVVPYYVPQKTDKDQRVTVAEIKERASDDNIISIVRLDESAFYEFEANVDNKRTVSCIETTDSNVWYQQLKKEGLALFREKTGEFVVFAEESKLFDYKDRGKEHTVTITAKKLSMVEYPVKVEVNPRGQEIKWKNPLISDKGTATNVANWLADYYKAGIEYEYKVRGNPEVDANDIIYQENEWNERLQVNVYRTELNFAQALTGKVWTRYIRKDKENDTMAEAQN